MSRKPKYTREQIINGAYQLVREAGIESIDARRLAKRLDCSTQPLFTMFKSMDEIKYEVKKKAYAEYDQRCELALKDAELPFRQAGINYIVFALEEPNLFKFLFTGRSQQTYIEFNLDHNHKEILQACQKQYGLNEKYAKELYFSSWVFVHGLAVLVNSQTIKKDKAMMTTLMEDTVRGTAERLKRKQDSEN